MSEDINESTESRQLADDTEARCLDTYNTAHDPKYTTFESYVAGYWGEDHLKARQAWIDAGKPPYKQFICSDNGMIRSETHRPSPVMPGGHIRR